MSKGKLNPGRRIRRAFVTAMLLPYLLLQAVTNGIMPVATDDGFAFVVCTGDSVAEFSQWADEGTLSEEADKKGHEGEECPWAVAHGPAALGPTMEVAHPVSYGRALERSYRALLGPVRHPSGLPRPRAPPSVT